MADNLQQRLDAIGGKMQLIVDRYAKLTERLLAANETIREQQATIESQRRQIDGLRRQVESLQVVGILSPKREDIDRSRTFLAELLRDINKCITELSE